MTTKIDTWESTMSRKDTKTLLDGIHAALKQEDEKGAFALTKKLPLAPELAMCFATQVGLGPELLKNSGFNLKDAEKKYGRDWLERL
ncbi:MAG: hypothetical protein LBJ46_08165 [Planctomycetota bacterium]|nr:hypothetical protein [Planctomycetota bacterium]